MGKKLHLIHGEVYYKAMKNESQYTQLGFILQRKCRPQERRHERIEQ